MKGATIMARCYTDAARTVVVVKNAIKYTSGCNRKRYGRRGYHEKDSEKSASSCNSDDDGVCALLLPDAHSPGERSTPDASATCAADSSDTGITYTNAATTS